MVAHEAEFDDEISVDKDAIVGIIEKYPETSMYMVS